MDSAIFGLPGKLTDRFVESIVVGSGLLREGITWFADINRIRILRFAERKYPKCYALLDGGDKRIMRAFLEPDGLSNTVSLLCGPWPRLAESDLGLDRAELGRLLEDGWGSEATFDNSFVERDEGADKGDERWFFINGIATSRDMARHNVKTMRGMFNRPFTLIHNPTQGLANDLIESALQKFTNINTEPVARAFLEIANALLDDSVENVVVIAHSQGTIITGDVLDLLYASIDRKYFDRTNMTSEEFDEFRKTSTGTVKSAEIQQAVDSLHEAGVDVIRKLKLYMFANAASRMCYINADHEPPFPLIESFANEHDIVTRLGVLARDDFHREDLIRIDGSLFTCNRYGHLLNAHYLPDFVQGRYALCNAAQNGSDCIDTSVHDPVRGNPCARHPKHVPGSATSSLFALYKNAQQQPQQPQRQQQQKQKQKPTSSAGARKPAA